MTVRSRITQKTVRNKRLERVKKYLDKQTFILVKILKMNRKLNRKRRKRNKLCFRLQRDRFLIKVNSEEIAVVIKVVILVYLLLNMIVVLRGVVILVYLFLIDSNPFK